MKRIFATALAFCACLCMTFAMTACAPEEPAGHVHNFNDWTVTMPATCVYEGVKVRVCNTCLETETAKIEKVPHSYELSYSKSPTCQEAGYDLYKCSVCGDKNEIPVAKVDHKPYSILYSYLTNGEYHWFRCAWCAITMNKEPHTCEYGVCVTCRESVYSNCVNYVETSDYHVYRVDSVTDKSYKTIVIREKYTSVNINYTCSIREIKANAFEDCINLETIYIPSNINKIGANAFAGCTKLKTIRYMDSQEEWNKVKLDPDWTGGITGIKVIFENGSSITV